MKGRTPLSSCTSPGTDDVSEEEVGRSTSLLSRTTVSVAWPHSNAAKAVQPFELRRRPSLSAAQSPRIRQTHLSTASSHLVSSGSISDVSIAHISLIARAEKGSHSVVGWIGQTRDDNRGEQQTHTTRSAVLLLSYSDCRDTRLEALVISSSSSALISCARRTHSNDRRHVSSRAALRLFACSGAERGTAHLVSALRSGVGGECRTADCVAGKREENADDDGRLVVLPVDALRMRPDERKSHLSEGHVARGREAGGPGPAAAAVAAEAQRVRERVGGVDTRVTHCPTHRATEERDRRGETAGPPVESGQSVTRKARQSLTALPTELAEGRRGRDQRRQHSERSR